MIDVAVHGALGKMGRQVLATLCDAEDMRPVGGIDAAARTGSLSLADGSGDIPLATTAEELFERARPQVVVDFTNWEAAPLAFKACAAAGVHIVSGSTGWREEDLEEAGRLAEEGGIGALIAPNFALGAVVLIHLARIAGRFFDYAEVLEAHHEEKVDAPSGTARAIAEAAAQGGGKRFIRQMPSKEPTPGTRGGEEHGVSIHATRMPGRLAHHELLLGAAGQTLSLRHDSINRDCFMPGVLRGIRHVVEHRGLVVGLDKVLRL